jgi:N4-gp56 family major capsid protein
MATTLSTLDNLLPKIIAEALFVASERSIMRGLVKNYTLPPGSGKTVNVPIYPLQTAQSLTEGVTLSDHTVTGYANVTPSSATLTVAEVGIATQITDISRLSSATNVVADIGRLFGEAIARKIDIDLTSKFNLFTTNVVGSSGNILAVTGAISAASVFEAVAKLRSAGVPSSDLACVLHPSVAYDLKANITNTFANPNAGLVQNEAMQMGYVGMLAGVPVYETSNFNTANATAGDYIGGLFHRDALGLAIMQDIKIESQRNALLRGDDLIATAMYGTGALYQQYGVALAFDSSIV